MPSTCRCVSCITPPHMLKKMLDSKDPEIRKIAVDTLITTAGLRAERTVRASMAGGLFGASSEGRRSIFDVRRRRSLSLATRARSENDPATADASVNRAYDGFGLTRAFYKEVYQRDSIDDKGMRLNGYVHFDRQYNNAFWNGQAMVFGDGDGKVFSDFTLSLDVIAHELAHGVTEHTAGLEYHNQSGALNESMSDVFGSLVKQWSKKQSAAQADWLIGAEVFTPAIKADALRSMKAPGTAFNNALFGKDPQPDHMNKFVELPDTEDGDNGGVHINSGIPNKAFHLAATGIGGKAWEAPGHIWYEALKASGAETDFQEFADTTFMKADQLYGAGSIQQKAVLDAWGKVGIKVGVAPSASGVSKDGLAELTKKIEALTAEVHALTKQVAAGKAKK